MLQLMFFSQRIQQCAGEEFQHVSFYPFVLYVGCGIF